MSPNFRQLLPYALLIFLVACNQRTQEGTVTGKVEMKTGPIVYVALGDSTGVGVGGADGGYVIRLFKRILEQRTALARAEAELWSWYVEWSAVAHLAIKQPAHREQLGLSNPHPALARKTSEVDHVRDEPPTATTT